MRTVEYRKCPCCGFYRHDTMYPWVDPAATTEVRPPRTDTAAAKAAYEKRLAEAARKRREAQAKGRDYAKCLPCKNGDA